MSTGRMKRGRVVTLAAISSLLLLCASVVHSQTTGNLEGTVTDQGGEPLPGVTIALTSPNLQGARSATTGAGGRYRFPGIPPGSYLVRASLEGFGAVEKKATVTLDATVAVTLQLNLSTTAEVTVTGEAPLIDATSTTAGSNYAGKVIGQLPLASRNYADVVFTQPGAQADNGETQGRSLAISIYGSTSAENSFLIDGVNTTSVIKGVQGKDINNEFVQEVEVKTGGYQAEYGRNTGGVINVITKSGGNEFHGALFGYYNSTGMKADTDFVSTPNYSESGDAQAQGVGVLVVDNRQEAGVDLGGFVWKDRIWFFAAYDRVRTNQSTTPTSVRSREESFRRASSRTSTRASSPSTSLPARASSGATSRTGRRRPARSPFPRASIRPPTRAGSTRAGPTTARGSTSSSARPVCSRFNMAITRRGTRRSPPVGTSSSSTITRRWSSGLRSRLLRRLRQRVRADPRTTTSTRNSYAATLTQYLGNHEVKAGGDYQKDVTRGSTSLDRLERRRDPSVHAGSDAPLRSQSGAPLYQWRGQHDARSSTSTTSRGEWNGPDAPPGVSVFGADHPLERISAGRVARHAAADGQSRRALRLRERVAGQRRSGVQPHRAVGAARGRVLGRGGQRHLEAVRIGRALLLCNADRSRGPGLHRQHVRRDVQLQPDLHRAGPRHADRSDPAGGVVRGRARRSGNQGVLPGRVHDRLREDDRHARCRWA